MAAEAENIPPSTSTFDEDIKKLMGKGRVHLVCNENLEAVKCFEEATKKLDEKYGQAADECGEAYFYYGKSLLEIARMEGGVLGNALQEVIDNDVQKNGNGEHCTKKAEEESVKKDGTTTNTKEKKEDDLFVGPDINEIAEEEKEKIGMDVTEAMTEDAFKEAIQEDAALEKEGKSSEEKEKTPEETKGETSSTDKEKEAEEEANTTENKETPMEAETEGKEEGTETSEGKKEDDEMKEDTTAKGEENEETKEDAMTEGEEDKETKEDATAEGEKDEETKEDATAEGEKDEETKEDATAEGEKDEETKEDATSEGEKDEETKEDATAEGEGDEGDGDDAEPMEGEGAENVESEPNEEDEPTYMELAWQMLEIARLIFQKRESKEGNLMLAQCHLKLGEIQMEQEQFLSAVEDFLKCLDLQKEHLQPDNRLLAETAYNIGLAFAFQSMHDKSKDYYKQALETIDLRIKNLQKSIDEAEAKSKGKEKATDDNPFVANRKELQELQELYPEIKAKVDDATEMMKQSNKQPDVKSLMGNGNSTTIGFGHTCDKDAPVSMIATKKAPVAVTDISHLVHRNKRKPEEASDEDTAAKKPRKDPEVEAAESNGKPATTDNGQTEATSAEK